jgi:hypothetical protein
MKTLITLIHSCHATKHNIVVGTTILFCKLKYEDVLRNVKNKKHQIIEQERIIKFK